VEGYQIFQCFVDLKKAYDVVDRSILWQVLKRFGLPDKLIRVIQAFHDGAQATVNVEGQRGDSFMTTNGLKQGSVLSPMLFNIFFGAIIQAARKEFRTSRLGIDITTRLRGRMLTPRNEAKRCNHKEVRTISDIGFADDLVLCAHSEGDLQKMVDILARITTAFGQTIATSKTKAKVVQSKQTSRTEIAGVNILLNDQVIQQVEEFKYLGSVQNSRGNMDNEVERRRSAMMQSYGRYQHILSDKRINLRVRLTLINVIGVPHGYYECQARNLPRHHLQRLESIYCYIIRKTMDCTNACTPLVEVIKLARR
jgi:hypothetical protein